MAYREPEFLPWDGRRVPITFVGGYLGAGKTTAINELLAHTDRPIAVIVNDLGAVNVDAALITRRHGGIIELSNGCVCCSSVDELGAAFDLIRARATPPDQVVVELSGVAEPERVLPWGSSAGFMLDALVIVVAADRLADSSTPAWLAECIDHQIQIADLLVLSKIDLVEAATQVRARARLAELAPGVAVLNTGRGVLEPGAVGRFLALGARRPLGTLPAPAPSLFDAHRVQTIAAPLGLSVAELDQWVRTIPTRIDGPLARVKGIVRTRDGGLTLVQVVGRRVELSVVPEPERQTPTDLVVISLAV